MIVPKRLCYNNSHYKLDKSTKTLVLNKEYHKQLLDNAGKFGGFKKITATYLGDILKVDNFKSPFAVFGRLCGVPMPVLDEKYINAGVILEPKIREKIEESLGSHLETYDAKEYNYDYFKDNKFFGGLPDGYSKEKNLIIEIKTTNVKNIENWEKYGLPKNYLLQAQLYAYLMKADKYSIVVLFLEDDDYKDPASVDINKRYLKNYRFTLDIPKLEDNLKKVEDWYDKYTKLGISPEWNDSIDADYLEFLECSNKEEWEKLYCKWVEEGKAVPKC